MFYSVISAKILRIWGATSFYNDFISNAHSLKSRMKKRRGEINHIKALTKMIFRHTGHFLKFNIKQEDIIKSITP